MANQKVIPSTAISQAPIEDVRKHKRGSLAEAMELARQTVRDPESLEDPDPDPYGYSQELENEYGVDLITPRWKAKPDDPLWNKRFKARARKAAVASMYLKGSPIPEIAITCEISQVTVYRDIQQISQEWRKSYLDDIEQLASRDLARLDYMFQMLTPAIDRGDAKAISAATDIIKQRSEILGYKAGVQVDITQYIRQVATSQGFDPDRAVTIAERVKITMK